MGSADGNSGAGSPIRVRTIREEQRVLSSLQDWMHDCMAEGVAARRQRTKPEAGVGREALKAIGGDEHRGWLRLGHCAGGRQAKCCPCRPHRSYCGSGGSNH